MKKKLLASLLILFLASAQIAFAASQSATVSVKVSPIFSLSLDTASIDFGTVEVGKFEELPEGSGYLNKANCKSNNGNVWRLIIQANNNLSSGANEIPINNLKWLMTYTSGLNPLIPHPPGQGYVDFKTSPEVVYESTAAEGSNLPNGTDVQFKYAVYLPDSQAAGNYQTTVIYTLTE